ncbi:CoA pyrophosphatase [Rhodovarius crocodyli]|uniref:CoA pyrophosphatase n=1 Tax=Rhodovarius crocodyli TaxID=1979269 RepID=A0A437MNC4_9PROT|nr:CoA pyrophosphatase [Rhodovarius crocodyli]RVT99137.1 CoA pyrophosphatase [Rhodovarius crocodyli]
MILDPASLSRLLERTASPVIEPASPLKPAAVLVPLVMHPEPTVLLTLRTATLSSHAGQVAFPGGRIEPGETPDEAALREAQEEIGLPPELVQKIGHLPEHVTGTGYLVTPIVGLVRPEFQATPEVDEVDDIFEVPLRMILDPASPRRESRMWSGRMREYWVWPHEKHFIWGATAAILVNLATVLRGEN